MKNKGIIIFLIILAVVIVVVIVADFTSTQPGKQGENPFLYDVSEFKKVDPALILYKETKDLKIKFDRPAGITYKDGHLFVVGDSLLQIIKTNGALVSEIALPDAPECIEVANDTIFIGFKKYLAVYNMAGEPGKVWEPFSEKSVITSLAVWDGNIFIADAGNRKVYRYSTNGKKLNEFEGKTSDDVLHGFIIPSPYFDLAVNNDGELWVVNPGNHAFENYTYDGNLRAYWENSSMKIEGFSGCCNPAHYAFLPDGSFVTSEKGMVRIKVYKPSGELLGVVAPPDKFKDDGHAPDITVDGSGNIYALDFDKKMIRLFEPDRALPE